jgi:hypothetical protein
MIEQPVTLLDFAAPSDWGHGNAQANVPYKSHIELGLMHDRAGKPIKITLYFQHVSMHVRGEANLGSVLVIIVGLTQQGVEGLNHRQNVKKLKGSVFSICQRIGATLVPLCKMFGFRVWFFSDLPDNDEDLVDLKNEIYAEVDAAFGRTSTKPHIQEQHFKRADEFDLLRRSLGMEIQQILGRVSMEAGPLWQPKT